MCFDRSSRCARVGRIASSEYVLGEELARFEQEFAAYCEVRHCVGVGSGTSAIQLALEALDVTSGDEVIAPANTFFGTVLPVLKLGAIPVLVDCDDDTATIDVDGVSAAIGPRTKAVVAVHLYGHPADVDPLRQLCEGHDLALVEDACQAHGARYKARRAGSLGTIAAFSFYPSKNLGAYGDGGAVTTDDEQLAERIRVLRNLGQSSRYAHVAEGWNERLDTIQAAILRVKLRHLEDRILGRACLACVSSSYAKPRSAARDPGRAGNRHGHALSGTATRAARACAARL